MWHRKRLRSFAVIALGWLLAGNATYAGEHEEHSEPFHKNLFGGFIGITGEERRERALTLGLGYERRVTESFGVGFDLERALGDLDFTVATAGLSWRADRWKFLAGAGVENRDGGDTEFLTRVGVEYGFERNGIEFAPRFIVDVVDGDVVLVYGLAAGFGF